MNKGNENKNAEISARIAEILQYTGETRNSFAVKLGYERAQTVYDIMNMKSAPSYDFFRRFSVSEYSDIIDVRWLLSGRGSMLRESVQLPREPMPASSDAVTLRLMDKLDDKDRKIDEKDTLLKEKDAENKHLQSELRSMEKELATYKAQSHFQNKESDHQSRISKVLETFTSESSGDYQGDYSPTSPPAISKKLSVGKI